MAAQRLRRGSRFFPEIRIHLRTGRRSSRFLLSPYVQTAAVSGLVAVVALVIAGLSLLWGPIAILAAIGLAYLALGRRRRAARKHEGLRVLR